MNTASRRRAYTLVEIIGVLPIIAVISTLTYMTAADLERMRAAENSARQDDAVLRDLVRRIQEDAGRATQADAGESPEAGQLTLRGPSGTVVYTAVAGSVTRLEQNGSEPAVRYAWKVQTLGMSFKIEAIRARPRLVWIVATMPPVGRGSEPDRILTAAATLEPGGTP
jgi:type II secretory pathway pseudopilin PulG